MKENKYKHQKSYSALVFTKDRRIMSMLDNTYNLFTKGSHVWSNLWLDLFGGFEPEFLEKSVHGKVECVTAFEEQENKQEQITELVPQAVILFSRWFSLESKDHAPKEHCLQPDKVLPKFEEYLEQCRKNGQVIEVPEDWKPVLEYTVNRFYEEEAVWVDRRASFFSRKTQISYQGRKALFESKEWKNDSQKYVRSLLGKWWGEEEQKGDYALEINRLCELKPTLENCADNLDASSLARLLNSRLEAITNTEIFKYRDLWNGTGLEQDRKKFVAAINKCFGKNGRPNKLVIFLLGESKEDLVGDKLKSKVIDDLDEAIETAEANLNFQHEPWMNDLKNEMEADIGVKYQPDGKTRMLEYFGEMAGISLREITSNKSNHFNRLGERLHYLKVVQTLPTDEYTEMIQGWMDEWLKQYKDFGESYFIKPISMNGLQEVTNLWLESSDWVESVNEASKSSSRFGDQRLFKYFAEKCKKVENQPENWFAPIKNWYERHAMLCKLDRLNTIYFRHISQQRPRHVGFGESRPKMKISFIKDVERGKDRIQRAHTVSLQLFNGKNTEMVDVPFVSDRFLREILIKDGEKTAPRNNSVFRSIYGENVCPDVELKGVRLENKNGKYYLNFTVALPEYQTMPKAEEIRTLKVGQRLMGVDLGQRAAAAYCIWEVVPSLESDGICEVQQNTIYRKVFCEGNHVWTKLLKYGFIADKQNVGDGQYAGCIMDRFTSKINDDVNDDEKTMWSGLVKKGVVLPEKKMPEDLLNFNRELIYSALNYTRDMVREEKNRLDRNKANYMNLLTHAVCSRLDSGLLDLVFNQLFSKRPYGRRVSSGALSYKRMETFQSLKDMLSTYYSWTKDSRTKERMEVVERKIVNMRRERVRITVNALVKLSLQEKVNVLFVENLAMSASGNSRKFFNKRFSQWCPKRVLEELREQAKVYGLFIRGVKPDYTSHLDFITDEEVARQSRMKLSCLLGQRWRNDIKKYTKPTMERSKRELIYKQAWENLALSLGTCLEGLVDFARQNPDRNEWIPCVSGDRVLLSKPSAHGASWDSDVNASCNIFLRGFKSLLWPVEKKNGGNGESKRKPPKSFGVRGKKKKNSG